MTARFETSSTRIAGVLKAFSRSVVGPERLIFLVLASCMVVYWAGILTVDLSLTSGHIIGSDGLFYYEYLPSMFIDGDLDFANQRAAMIRDGLPNRWSASFLQPSARTHLPGTPFASGWALMVSPFFLGAHLYTLAFASALSLPTDGYGFVYESVTNFGAVLYGCLGVLLLFRTLRTWVDEWIAAMAVCGTLATSNLLYYIVVQASMSHSVAFFAVAGAFYFCNELTQSRASYRHALLFGVFCGLSFVIRPQLVLSSAALFVYLAAFRVKGAYLACAAAASAAVALIQLSVWNHLYGSPFIIPQGEGFMRWSEPHVLDVLFSRRHGLFLWHPVYLLGVLGLLFNLQRRLALCLLCLGCIAMQVYVNAAVSDWWAGNAFGGRRFVDSLPFFATGVALLLAQVRQRALVIACFVVLSFWNAAFAYQYRFGYIPRGEEITWSQLITDKFRLHRLSPRY